MFSKQANTNRKTEEPGLDEASSPGSSLSVERQCDHPLPKASTARQNNASETTSSMRAIQVYVEKLRREGGKVPAHPLRPQRPHYPLISKVSGVSLKALATKTSPEGGYLMEAATELGLEPHPEIAENRVVSYGSLTTFGSESRKRELVGKGSAGAQLSNTKTALNKFLEHVGKTSEDAVGPELLKEDVLQEVADTINNADTRRKFLGEIKRWGDYYLELHKDMDLPPEFSLALSIAIARSGKLVSSIAKEAGVGQKALTSWVTGSSHPTQSIYPAILAIEEDLGLPSGSLISRVKKIGDRRFSLKDYPETVTVKGEKVIVRENHGILQRLRPLLPDDFNERSLAEREEMVAYLIEHLIGPATDWAFLSMKRHRSPYALKFTDSAFVIRDIGDPAGLLTKLRSGRDHISSHFLTQLPPRIKQMIENYDGSSPLPKTLRKPLVDGLNSLLKGPSLFSERYFAPEELTPETRNLIERNPQGKYLIYLNRLLLEEVYSQEIIKCLRCSLVLDEEWDELEEYKDGNIPPGDIERMAGVTWVPETRNMYKKRTACFLGMLSLSATADDPKMRGLGLNPDTFCLPMLSCVRFARVWIKWLGKRRATARQMGEHDEEGAIEKEVNTEIDATYIRFLASLFAPNTGWLRQRKDLLDHMQVIPGFIDEAFIAHAKQHWRTVCNNAYRAYINLARNLQASAEQTRDPFEQILPILQSEKPLEAMKIFARNIWEDMPDASLAPMLAATRRRDHMIVRILGITGFRSKQMRQLVYKTDDTGELRWENGRWVIVISWKKFKNKNSSFFGRKNKKHDYRKVLPDVDGLYDQIREYVEAYRPILLKGRSSSVFFVSTGGKAMMSKERFSENYRKLTTIYLAYNPYLKRGIPGVKPHRPHAGRDIMATHVLKMTGSYDAAAYSIQDIKRTVELHYCRFLPEDKVHFVDDIVTAAFS